MIKIKITISLMTALFCGVIVSQSSAASHEAAFEHATTGAWEIVFSDSCTNDWTEQWFLDGEVGNVSTDAEGMTLTAGPEFKNDAHHMVLWTQEHSFH